MKLKYTFIKWLFNTLSPLFPGIMGKIGYYFSIQAPKLAVKPHHLDFFKTAGWINLELNGKKVQVYKWGSGEKNVLLLHGWASNSFWWRHHIRTLSAKGFSVYAMDAPGNGLSEGNQLNIKIYAQAIQLLVKKISTFELVAGHSFGGFVTMYVASILGPDFTNKIAILGAPDSAKLFFHHFEHTLGFNKYAMDALLAEFTRQIGHPPDFFDTALLCQNIKAEGLIIHDTEDEDTPYQCAVNLSKAWHNAEFMSTTGFGHALKDASVYHKVLKLALK